METFLVTKLSRPRTNRWYLPRPHLADLMREGLNRRLTALIAAAGHGKTFTLGNFLANAGTPYLWIQMDPSDSDPRLFAQYLAHGIHSELGGGRRALAALNGPGSLPPLVPLLVADLADCAGDVAIVLDDFHLVDRESPVGEMVLRLLQYSGTHVHLFMCSRTPLPFSIARMKVTQEATEITEDDLRFTPAEVQIFMKEMAGLDLNDAQLEQVFHLTEGWTAALVLLAEGLRRRGSLDRALSGALPADLFTYLADELFRSLAADVQLFMEESAILDVCSPVACDAILERSDSAVLLAQLLNSNLLLTQLSPDSFRYHHLLQRFLLERLRSRDGGRSFRNLHRRAGDWYLAREQPEEAVRYYLRGEWLEEAASLVERLAPLWLRTNRLERLRTLLSYLPTETKEQYPWISLCEARHLANAGQTDAAIGMSRLAQRSFDRNGDQRGVVQALTLIGEIMQGRQQFQAAREAFQAAQAALRPQDLYEEGLVLQKGAMLKSVTDGPSAEVESDLRRALSIYTELGDLPMEALISDQLGLVRAQLGDFASAIRFLERGAEISRSLGEEPYEIGLNLSWCYCQVGRFHDAAKLAEPILASSSRKMRRLYAAANLIYIYTRLGDFTKAASVAQSAHALSEELGQMEVRADVSRYLAGLYRLSGQPQTAIPFANEALQLVKQIDRSSHQVRPATEASLLHLFHTGNAQAAGRMVEKALTRLGSGSALPYERLVLNLILAVVEFRQTRTESRPEGVRLLQESLAECHMRGYQFFALHEWQLALAVVVYGLAYGVNPQVCLELIEIMTERLPATVPQAGITLMEPEARLLAAAWQSLPDDGSRKSFGALLTPADRRRVVGLAIGPAPVHIQCLGALHLAVGSETVDVKALKKRKSGLLLVLLLASDGPLPRDQVVDRLWPDLDPEAADTSLRVSLHHLRRLLEPHLGGKSKSRYIQSEGGLIWFSRQPEVSVDLDRFRQSLQTAEEAVAQGGGAAAAVHFEAACRLYRGDLASDDPYSAALEDLRTALQDRYARALDWLGKYYWEEASDPARAILAYKQRLVIDPAHEQTHQALIRVYLEIGQVSAARQQYSACREALAEHLGVPPSRTTESLLQLALSMENEAPVEEERRRASRRR